ncbi:prolyl oligopeptidase family serine peptidase [Chryseobacterium sp. OSA05B]|uniref:S9 family peptidase n=1 Tax=Chryseobacterium sp. OSA05B TaxID=2862650 RepID=UPI001CBDB984|nr:prolyl oligopeptidase family serine peptidase [Chryseobacterium sp. OSA05B]
MAIKRIRKRCLFVWFVVIVGLVSGQQGAQRDTLDQWISKFYETDGLSMSPDGRWVAVKKRYTDQDSILIFDTKNKKGDKYMAAKASMIELLDDHHAMLTGQGQASWWNLLSKKNISYGEVKQSGVWSADGYCILNRSGQLQIMDAEGKILAQYAGVEYYITDGKGNLMVQAKTQEGHEILKFQNPGFRKLLDLDDFERMEFTDSDRYVAIYRQSSGKGFRNIMLMDIGKETWSYPLGKEGTLADYLTLKEIGKGDSFLIEAVKNVPYPENEVEIWYGNDRNLESREFGRKPSRRYWNWKSGRDRAIPFSTLENETISSIGSDRYFVVFRGDELQDYVHHIPDLNLSLYDTLTGKRISIGRVGNRSVSSKDGSLILFTDTRGIWHLLHVKTLEKQKIRGEGLKKPYFSEDSKTIYFESDSGIWMYSVQSRKTDRLSISRGQKVQMIGGEQKSLCTGYNFYQSVVHDHNGLVLKIEDSEKGEVSYEFFKNGKSKLMYFSSNHVKSIVFSRDLTKMAGLEENFNKPPELWMVEAREHEKKLLLESESSDRKAVLLRQQIISYTTSLGIPLKGILYYPVNYNPLQEYPVIVHIYQKQSDQAKNYLLPRYDEIGFNIRTLVERGYFVYLPDVVIENGSPGTSGLDAVERSLDALKKYPLKLNRFGLIGHSFGSYLTNFIATHSNRFSAYISGSGVSDLVSSYFSYNRNYSSPHYWQLETGQYEMERSFFKDKELYMRNNPILNADRVGAPILLWTGLKDQNVVPEQTMEFYIALKRSGKQVVALLYRNGGHDLGIGTRENRDLNRRMIDWWDYFLKDKSDIEWIDQQMKKDAQ